MSANIDVALEAAVSAIYFNDSSDYLSYLWDVVRALDPELADLLENDEGAAYDTIKKRINPEYKP